MVPERNLNSLPAFTRLQIENTSFGHSLDSSIKYFLLVHGGKLTYLESTARLGDLFRYCTNVTTWHAMCSRGFVSGLLMQDQEWLASNIFNNLSIGHWLPLP